jgi:hypothetical protein
MAYGRKSSGILTMFGLDLVERNDPETAEQVC